jgi:HlyD family secretion protein
MKKTTWMALAALLGWAFAPRPVEVETAAVGQGRFETTIDEDGKTRLRERYVVSAPLAGRLARIALHEGDVVQADAVVATLTPVLSPMLDERTRRELEVRVEIAQAQVHRVSSRIDAAKVALLQATSEVQRSEQLARQGFVSSTKLESDRLAMLGAEKALETAKAERHIASHEVEQARTALSAARGTPGAATRAFELRAPIAGRVLRVVQPSETVVSLGTPLLELGDTRQLEVVAELLTADALKARPGSRVVIERWGGEPLQGRVRRVEPAAFTKVSALGVEEQRVKVLIDITSAPEHWLALGDGFRVGVRIVTLSMDGAVKVPASAVFPLPQSPGDDGAGMAVFVVDGGRARLTPVYLGARNGAEAWVRSGLKPGATVIVYPPPGVGDGVRVKVRGV